MRFFLAVGNDAVEVNGYKSLLTDLVWKMTLRVFGCTLCTKHCAETTTWKDAAQRNPIFEES